jgi:hypothetical protein
MYLVAERPDLAPVVERAAVAGEGSDGGGWPRVDPVTAGVGALVGLLLQTDVQLERPSGGKSRFKLRKKAMSCSTLGRLLGKLLATYRPARAVGGVVPLVLDTGEVAKPFGWRWLLSAGALGSSLADHVVKVDPAAAETVAFGDVYRFVRWGAAPDRRVISRGDRRS